MADIQDKLDTIRAAVNGEEVRGTIADALEAMNAETNNAEKWATGAGTVDPGSGDTPGTENNAKYYAEAAEAALADIPSDYTALSDDVKSVTEFQDYVYAIGTLNCYIGVDGKISSESHSKTVYAPCKPNTVYKVTKTAGTRFRIGFASTTPANNVICTGVIADGTAGTIVSAASPSDAAYICAFVYYSSTDSGTATDMIKSVRFQEMAAKSSPAETANADMLQATSGRAVASLMPLTYSALGDSMMVSGGLSAAGVAETDGNAARLGYFVVSTYRYVEFPARGRVQFYFYDSLADAGFAERSQVFDAFKAVPVPVTDHPYMRLVYRKEDGTAISASDVATLNAGTKLYSDQRTENILTYALDRMKADYAYRRYSSNSDGLFVITKGECANTSTGRISTNTKYARTGQIRTDGTPWRLDRIAGFQMYVTYYSSTTTVIDTFISMTRVYDTSEAVLLTPPEGAKTFLLSIHADDWRTITDTDVTTIHDSLRFYTQTPVDPPDPSFTEAECRTAFVSYMNAYAARIGMDDSTFLNASGLSFDAESCPQDELKMAVAVAGNRRACDIWSSSDRDFKIGGEDHERTISVVNNFIGAEPAGATYKLLGGKGGSLTTGNTRIKARLGIWEVNGAPVVVAAMSPGQFAYDNMATITQDICACVKDAMDGNTPTPSANIAQMITDGGGYAAVPVPYNAAAYINWYGPTDLLARQYAVSNNADATQTPASTTKTLTMLCVLDIIDDLLETVEVVSGDISTGSGSTFYAGDRLTVEDALRIMMMESSNTMAELVGREAGKRLLTMQTRRDG